MSSELFPELMESHSLFELNLLTRFLKQRFSFLMSRTLFAAAELPDSVHKKTPPVFPWQEFF